MPDRESPIFTLQEQARALSSGTLANLTGFNRYDEIDPIRLDFMDFCEENAHLYQVWQTAWDAFWAIARIKYKRVEKCEHPIVILRTRRYRRETRFTPAEYEERIACCECGAELDQHQIDDTTIIQEER